MREPRESAEETRRDPVSVRLLMAAFLMVGLSACRSTTPSGPTGGPTEMREQGMGEQPGTMGGESWRAGSDRGLTTIYFDYDMSALRPDAKDGLKSNAGFLRSNPGVAVVIEGNCDERGSEEYNLALGMRRAEAAKRYLMDLGIEAARLSTISYGEERPAELGSTETAWSKNRRDDFKVRR
jgi:peptidoglycan-associated lipoprotein